MNNIRLFFPKSLSINLRSNLDKPQSHYLNRVMRLKIGEKFSLFNQSGEWETKIDNISKGLVEFIVEKKIKQKNIEKNIWLAFAPIKSNYFTFMIQKATELGVTKFLPVISERTIVRKINLDRLSKIIIEACEQSNRISVPKIEKTVSLDDFIKKNSTLKIVFGDLNTNNNNLKINNLKDEPVCILIGPEGDFSEKERKKILNLKNVQCLKLNNNILRSETAAISALSIINYCLDL